MTYKLGADASADALTTRLTPLHSTPLGETPLAPLAEHEELRTKILDFCRQRLTDFCFHTWLEPLVVLSADESLVRIGAGGHLRGWVSERYGELLREASAAALGRRVEVRLVAPSWTPEQEEVADLRRRVKAARERHLLERQLKRYGETK